MPQRRHLRPSLVIPHILQNTFRAIVHRTVHRPLCHEYLAPDRTTFSGLSSFYTVLWHITLKAICKITEFLTCLKHATSRPSQVFLSILQNTFSPIGSRTVHRPLCHEYLAPRSHQLEQPGRKEEVNVRLGYFFIQNGCYFDIFRYLYER